ncbi:hypothetical protein As57867_011555, partial [Aphanomyces stellatus]
MVLTTACLSYASNQASELAATTAVVAVTVVVAADALGATVVVVAVVVADVIGATAAKSASVNAMSFPSTLTVLASDTHCKAMLLPSEYPVTVAVNPRVPLLALAAMA